MALKRYLRESTFCSELQKLHAYNERVSTSLLAQLEHAGLLKPRLRLQFPEPIARRLWFEMHSDHVHQMTGDIEPDGPRWDAACALLNDERRWSNPTVYGACNHPFDQLEEQPYDFLFRPADSRYRMPSDQRVDVSNDAYPQLFDATYVRCYYSSSQLLLAAEVADAGVLFRINLADEQARSSALAALDSGKAPSDRYSYHFRSVWAIRAFAEHERALDSVVWYAEEADRRLAGIVGHSLAPRFRLTQPQAAELERAREQLSLEAIRRYGSSEQEIVTLCQYLVSRWADWERNQRAAVAVAYKAMLWNAVDLLRRLGLSLDRIRELVGFAGGSESILDKIWPDWVEQEKQRVLRTLSAPTISNGSASLSPADLKGFVDFISANGVEAFFWRLRSFEEHAFGGNSYALEGMRADLQGLAISVEHIAAALGSTEVQLYEKFKELWREPSVLAILRRGDVTALARQARLADDWPVLKSRIEALRSEPGGDAAADLVLAHRIRGGVHYPLPEDDHFELESQFVALMRAAALTFAEVRRRQLQRGVDRPDRTVLPTGS